ncbi:unnamed protein product [Lampetra fluviatilis]
MGVWAARSPTSTTTTSTTIIFIVAAPAAACPLPTLAGVGAKMATTEGAVHAGRGGRPPHGRPRRCLRRAGPRCQTLEGFPRTRSEAPLNVWKIGEKN